MSTGLKYLVYNPDIMVKHNSEDFYCQIGTRIAQARKENDLTQQQLATLLNLRQQVIASYETGSRRIPLPVLLRIAEVLKSPIENLLPLPLEQKSKRGPVPKIQKQWEKLLAMPEEKQKIISNLIDSWTSQ
jgi:transcriptional regulator with XRE-family HTH domain